MTKYYHQTVMEMELRNFSAKTIRAYVGQLTAFAKMFRKSLDELGENEIRPACGRQAGSIFIICGRSRRVSSSNINHLG
jgi:hypothetical protein